MPLFMLRWVVVKDSIKTQDILFTDEYSTYPMYVFALEYAEIIINNLTGQPMGWLVMIRYWLIHYNVQWTKVTLASKWKIHLNQSEVNRNWYLRHRSTFGNVSYVLKRVMIIVFVIVIINLIYLFLVNIDEFDPWIIIGALFNITPLISVFVLYFKIRKFDDNFYIITELKRIVMAYIFGIVSWVIIDSSTEYATSSYQRDWLLSISAVFWNTVAVFIQTWWVLRDNKSILDPESYTSPKKMDTVSQSSSNPDGLEILLTTGSTFEMFMEHLSKE